jgi:peptide deformylase
MDHIDPDMLVKHVTDVLGVPRKVLRSDQEIVEIRKSRAEQEQAAMEQQELMQNAQAAGQAAPMAKVLQEGE